MITERRGVDSGARGGVYSGSASEGEGTAGTQGKEVRTGGVVGKREGER